MGYLKCRYCGDNGYYDNFQPTPQGWVWNKTYGSERKIYCSMECLKADNLIYPLSDESKTNSSIENSGDSDSAMGGDNDTGANYNAITGEQC